MEQTKPSKEVAKLFYSQCMGETEGHMSMIKNNSFLYEICSIHGVKDCRHGGEKEFAEFLRGIASHLD